MVDVLERPAAYNLPCLWPEPVPVDRRLRDGEIVHWEEFHIQFLHLPGQTEYTQGVLVEIDGKKILFDGDTLAPPLPGRPLLGHYVSRNYQRLDGDMSYVARKMIELKPDFIAPFHFDMIPANGENLNSFLRSTETFQNVARAIIDQPDPQMGIDNNWLSAYPYQSDVGPGQTASIELRLRNWTAAPMNLSVRARGPEGWKIDPPEIQLAASAKKTRRSLRIAVPDLPAVRSRRFVITFDTWRDGKPLGEITEALINVEPMKAH
jgi:glyoxylase-like metal-dependent hydrolase (beta-lactamase superfamily II)